MGTSNQRPIMIIVGTRPEGIKMIPVYFALKEAQMPVILCSTTQHSALLTEVFHVFNIKPDIELNVMRPDQDLFYVTEHVLHALKNIFMTHCPRLVLVQGDTTSSMAAALAAFYLKIPIGHIEAGLRTQTVAFPFPEEFNRRVISLIATWHFTPTAHATAQLLAENIARNAIFCTGNTITDALRLMRTLIYEEKVNVSSFCRQLVSTAKEQQKKLILFTAHRRESFGAGLQSIFKTIKKASQHHEDCIFFYPHHPNPAIKTALHDMQLDKQENIVLSDSVAYPDLVFLLLHAAFVITDSGGVSEEAMSMGKSVLVLRNETERIEGVWSGLATLVGTKEESILAGIEKCIKDTKKNTPSNIFGDGYAAAYITKIIKDMHEGIDSVKISRMQSFGYERGAI